MNTLSVILVIVVVLVLFLVLREFWCWYFKINKVIRLLERIEENTRKPADKPVAMPIRY